MCGDSGRSSWKVGAVGAFLLNYVLGVASGFPSHLPGTISSEPYRAWGDEPGLITPLQMGKETLRAEGHRVTVVAQSQVSTDSLYALTGQCFLVQPTFFSWGCCLRKTVGYLAGRGLSWRSVPMGFYADISRLLVVCYRDTWSLSLHQGLCCFHERSPQLAGRNRSD